MNTPNCGHLFKITILKWDVVFFPCLHTSMQVSARVFLRPIHTFRNENWAIVLRFQKGLRTHLWFSCRFLPSTLQSRSREKPHGSVCPTFWILTVQSSGARSRLFWWRHRFQIAWFSPSTLENSVFKKHRFQIAPLWRAFSNGSDFGDRFRRLIVDDGRIRSKTPPFAFENGFVWKSINFSISKRITEISKPQPKPRAGICLWVLVNHNLILILTTISPPSFVGSVQWTPQLAVINFGTGIVRYSFVSKRKTATFAIRRLCLAFNWVKDR